jgi:hypothetical protein
MKVFRLSCSRGHDFEGWFASSGDFDRQSAAGAISCPICEDRHVKRLPSAPYVNTGPRERGTLPAVAPGRPASTDLTAAITAFKAYVKANTEDVGRRFPEVARRMHYGEEPSRGIRGRVTPQEAGELQEEGIEAVALPDGLAPEDGLH